MEIKTREVHSQMAVWRRKGCLNVKLPKGLKNKGDHWKPRRFDCYACMPPGFFPQF